MVVGGFLMDRVILCCVCVKCVSEFINSSIFKFWLWKYLVIVRVVWYFFKCISGEELVGVVIIMECWWLFMLRIFLINFLILCFCLLINLIIMICVVVFWVIMLSVIDLLILELVNKLICCFLLIVSKLLIVLMLIFKGLLIGLCVSGLIGIVLSEVCWLV